MPIANYFIRQGDTQDAIRAIFRDAAGDVIPPTGQAVTFIMVNADTEVVKVNNGVAALVNPAALPADADYGMWQYSWAAGDTDTAGLYLARWVMTSGLGKTRTVPNEGDLLIQVYA